MMGCSVPSGGCSGQAASMLALVCGQPAVRLLSCKPCSTLSLPFWRKAAW